MLFPSPSPSPYEPLLYEVEFSNLQNHDAAILCDMLVVHGQQPVPILPEGAVARLHCSARALRLLLLLQENGLLPCDMLYRKIKPDA